MATIKEIRDRINSVNDTRKITNAMYLISSTKLRKARKMLTDTEPFFFSTQAMISRIVRHLPQGVENIFLETRLDIPEKERRKGLLVPTTTMYLSLLRSISLMMAIIGNCLSSERLDVFTLCPKIWL